MGHLDTATLASSTCVDLGLYHPKGGVYNLNHIGGLINGRYKLTIWNRYSRLLKNIFGLKFM